MCTREPPKILVSPSQPRPECPSDNEEFHLIVHENEIIHSKTRVYQVQEFIAAGGYGIVYKVQNITDPSNPIPAAMKILKNLQEINPVEDEILHLQHLWQYLREDAKNGMVQLTEAFIYQQHEIIVMELLGPSLYDIVCVQREYIGLPYPFLQLMLRDLCPLLANFSVLDLVHADIKPENILTCGEMMTHVKLVDFGSLTNSIFNPCVAMTLFYRAPEATLGLQITPKSDIFSLGCVLFEIYVGLPLFAFPNPENYQLTIVEETYWLLHQYIHFLGPIPLEMLERAGQDTPVPSLFSGGELIHENSARYTFNFSITEDFNYFNYNTIGEIINEIKFPDYNPIRSQQLIDLLLKMLQYDPERRISAEEILHHPFLQPLPPPEI